MQDNDKPLAVLLKYEHFIAMQEMIAAVNSLFIFGGFAHDSQGILAAVQRFAFVGLELRRNTVTPELSVAPFAHADGGVLFHNQQFAFGMNPV